MKESWQELMSIDGFEVTDISMWVENLIYNSTLQEVEKCEAEQLNNNPDTPEEIMDLVIGYLIENQIDPILGAQAYNQTDINKHIKRICNE